MEQTAEEPEQEPELEPEPEQSSEKTLWERWRLLMMLVQSVVYADLCACVDQRGWARRRS